MYMCQGETIFHWHKINMICIADQSCVTSTRNQSMCGIVNALRYTVILSNGRNSDSEIMELGLG